ncbi:sugar ABC transporter permease [Paenibacillus rhizosphaerae]|uniref:Sugar ABC transporter permease n=3 Tax=Paenibacillus TaxID=44249 RepID=A0A1R1ERI7_9BACL|nr:sugar ABC transporter permease [Paenibacillus rhizosphaerae]OXL82217.1 sugar ABC transporter permease [Paenibacillus sp. SSG-1]
MCASSASRGDSDMAGKKKRRSKKWIVNIVLGIICFVWLLPTLGLLISSFRPAADILETGWWKVFPHQEWKTKDTIQLSKDVDLRGPIEVNGQTYTDDQLKSGVMQDGKRLTWENRRAREISVQDQGWVGSSKLTLDNYKNVITGKEYTIKNADGSESKEKGTGLSQAFWNTLTIAVPATVIPVLIASFAAYAFAWLRFPGRKTLFVVIIAMLVIPIQVALIPVLKDYTSLGLNGSYLGIWLAHTAFGLPLVTYFMYNFISQLPKDLFESAFMDGATHFTIFSRLILPLSVPALASIGIFQFLWVWNDYLVSLIFIGNQPEVQVMSMKIADLVGSRGNDWHLLTSAAFISMLMPLAIFFLLQKYFVRGLMGGSVKG